MLDVHVHAGKSSGGVSAIQLTVDLAAKTIHGQDRVALPAPRPQSQFWQIVRVLDAHSSRCPKGQATSMAANDLANHLAINSNRVEDSPKTTEQRKWDAVRKALFNSVNNKSIRDLRIILVSHEGHVTRDTVVQLAPYVTVKNNSYEFIVAGSAAARTPNHDDQLFAWVSMTIDGTEKFRTGRLAEATDIHDQAATKGLKEEHRLLSMVFAIHALVIAENWIQVDKRLWTLVKDVEALGGANHYLDASCAVLQIRMHIGARNYPAAIDLCADTLAKPWAQQIGLLSQARLYQVYGESLQRHALRARLLDPRDRDVLVEELEKALLKYMTGLEIATRARDTNGVMQLAQLIADVTLRMDIGKNGKGLLVARATVERWLDLSDQAARIPVVQGAKEGANAREAALPMANRLLRLRIKGEYAKDRDKAKPEQIKDLFDAANSIKRMAIEAAQGKRFHTALLCFLASLKYVNCALEISPKDVDCEQLWLELKRAANEALKNAIWFLTGDMITAHQNELEERLAGRPSTVRN